MIDPENSPKWQTIISYEDFIIEIGKRSEFKQFSANYKELPEYDNPYASSVFLNLMGCFKTYEGRHDDAISYYTSALSLLERQSDLNNWLSKAIACIYHNIGCTYSEQREKGYAKHFFDKSFSIKMTIVSREDDLKTKSSAISNPFSNPFNTTTSISKSKSGTYSGPLKTGQLRSYHRSALLYYDLKEYDIALRFENEAIHLATFYLGDKHIALADNYHSLGKIYSEKKEYVPAIKSFLLAIQLKLPQRNDHPLIGSCFRGIVGNLSEVNETTLSVKLLQKKKKIISKLNDIKFQERLRAAKEQLRYIEEKRDMCNLQAEI